MKPDLRALTAAVIAVAITTHAMPVPITTSTLGTRMNPLSAITGLGGRVMDATSSGLSYGKDVVNRTIVEPIKRTWQRILDAREHRRSMRHVPDLEFHRLVTATLARKHPRGTNAGRVDLHNAMLDARLLQLEYDTGRPLRPRRQGPLDAFPLPLPGPDGVQHPEPQAPFVYASAARS